MSSLGKRILSAFVEVDSNERPAQEIPAPAKAEVKNQPAAVPGNYNTEKFARHFEQLFADANLPGPDYFEFSRMTDAMQSIPDERARYAAAFAGLSVQGLDKTTLLQSAAAYLKLLEQDALSFNQSVGQALQNKVAAKKQDIEAKQTRIEQLSRELSDLQQQIELMHLEIKESEEKITANTSGYNASAAQARNRIEYDIERIQQHIKG